MTEKQDETLVCHMCDVPVTYHPWHHSIGGNPHVHMCHDCHEHYIKNYTNKLYELATTRNVRAHLYDLRHNKVTAPAEDTPSVPQKDEADVSERPAPTNTVADFECVIYPVHVVITDDAKYLADIFDACVYEDQGAITSEVITTDDDKHVILMAFHSLLDCDITLLSHEVIHASWHILDFCGVTVTADNHEALTYLHGHILRESLKVLGNVHNKYRGTTDD